jgi:RNA polymerase sigma factor for flagellar operon FliA
VTIVDSPETLARFHAELDLVDLLARQLSRDVGSVASLDDLRSFGREGLLQAARTFDAGRGVPFRRWANLRVRGAILDGVRAWGPLPRRLYRKLRGLEAGDALLAEYDEEDAAHPAITPEAADDRLDAYLAGLATAFTVGALAPPPGESLGPDVEPTPEELLGEAQMMQRVKAVLAGLPEKERLIVERHYFEGMRLDHAAESVGLSKSWGSRLHARALETLTRELRQADDL